MQLTIFTDFRDFQNLALRSKPLGSISIENRRFLGNKFKLLPFIKRSIDENCEDLKVICDVFAGTGAIGTYLSTQDNRVIFNDILKSCTVPIKAFATTTKYDKEKIDKYINEFNELGAVEDNYFSVNFGGKYFTQAVARKIGAIRELIEEIKVTEQEKNILLTSLLYAVDKIANTVGHYDAYRKALDHAQQLELKPLNIPIENNKNNVVYEEDANRLVRRIKKVDLLYIDPPYNSRQYSDSYHLLENLTRWEKPKVFGKAAKMDRKNLKSRYCLKEAQVVFQDLIDNADCRYVLVSYNNTGDKRDKRSNSRISSEQIITTLKRRGRVKVFQRRYREFTAGKSALRPDHRETLYFCEITK